MVDVFILSLLLCSLGYGYILSRRLEKLRRVLIDLKPALDAFSDAVDQSQRSVAEMKEVSNDLAMRESGLVAKPTQRVRASDTKPAGKKDVLIRDFFSGRRGRA